MKPATNRARRFPACLRPLIMLPARLKALIADERIVFNACNHQQSVEILYKDWERLVQPTVASFARKK